MTDRREDMLDFLDGTLPEDKQAELRAWLDESPERWDELARLSFLHSAIGDQLRKDQSTAVFQLETLSAFPPGPTPAEQGLTKKNLVAAASYVLSHTLTPKRLAFTAAAAIVLLAGVLLIPWGGSGSPTPEPIADDTPREPDRADPDIAIHVATITAEYDAKWQTASGRVAPSVGDGLKPGRRLALTDGAAQITTGSGAVVTLQGPVEVQTHTEGRLELVRGKLIARCETPESKGFTVFTDTAEVTDIGTVFGVELNALGQTLTGVLSGHIVLSYTASDDEPRLLKAGDVAGVSAQGLPMAKTPDDVTQTFRAWGSMLRPVTVTGDALFVDSMPNEFPEDEQLVRVYRESVGVLLQDDLTVSRTEPGLYRPVDGNQQTTIAAGTRVDSYFVHIDRPRSPANFATRQFTISFDQPVVALIVHTGLLTETTQQLGAPGVQYLKLGGLGLVSKSGFNPDNPQVDSIQWSDDRKTLTVTLKVQNQDQFRVLTLSPEAASADGNRE